MMASPEPSDFSSMGFAAGVVRGLRAFNVGDTGILMGIVYRQWWLTGEMTAICCSEKYDYMSNESHGRDASEFAPPDHDMEHCKHGLYAFLDGSNDYSVAMDSRVSAIVEGYGEVMIGPRGFRAAKAQIVALASGIGTDDGTIELVQQNYSVIPWFDSVQQMIAEYPLGEIFQ